MDPEQSSNVPDQSLPTTNYEAIFEATRTDRVDNIKRAETQAYASKKATETAQIYDRQAKDFTDVVLARDGLMDKTLQDPQTRQEREHAVRVAQLSNAEAAKYSALADQQAAEADELSDLAQEIERVDDPEIAEIMAYEAKPHYDAAVKDEATAERLRREAEVAGTNPGIRPSLYSSVAERKREEGDAAAEAARAAQYHDQDAQA